MEDAADNGETSRSHPGRSERQSPAPWVSTDDLECELWNAIAEDCSGTFDEDEVGFTEEIEERFSMEDEVSDEAEERGLLFRQLSLIRPQLAELLRAAPEV
jgi:hypothetical protein